MTDPSAQYNIMEYTISWYAPCQPDRITYLRNAILILRYR